MPTVRPITAPETRPMRQVVLRPGKTLEELVYPGDDDELCAHLGAFDDAGHMVMLERPEELAAELAAFARAASEGDDWRIFTGGDAPTDLLARRLVISAGLGAQACARVHARA